MSNAEQQIQKKDLKIKLGNHAQFLEAWDSLVKLGYHSTNKPETCPYLYAYADGRIEVDFFDVEGSDLSSPKTASGYFNNHQNKEITLDELKIMAYGDEGQRSTVDLFEPTIQPQSIDGSLNPLNPTNFTQYVGTKELLAMPMTRGDWCKYNGWQLPPNENGNDDGYMVQYLDGGKPNHPNHPFYISWSPKDVFERTYHAVDGELPVPTAVNCGESSGSVGEAKSCSGNVSYGNHRAIELLLEILRGTNVGSDVSDKARTKLSELVDTI
ncbi:hypothetical protein [Acinetobacter sp. ANC 4193]